MEDFSDVKSDRFNLTNCYLSVCLGCYWALFGQIITNIIWTTRPPGLDGQCQGYRKTEKLWYWTHWHCAEEIKYLDKGQINHL